MQQVQEEHSNNICSGKAGDGLLRRLLPLHRLLMNRSCTQCSAPFEITEEDLKFYDAISPVFVGVKQSIPPPTLCPDCRQQRRLAMRNSSNLYHRKSDLSGKQIISIYSPINPIRSLIRKNGGATNGIHSPSGGRSISPALSQSSLRS